MSWPAVKGGFIQKNIQLPYKLILMLFITNIFWAIRGKQIGSLSLYFGPFICILQLFFIIFHAYQSIGLALVILLLGAMNASMFAIYYYCLPYTDIVYYGACGCSMLMYATNVGLYVMI